MINELDVRTALIFAQHSDLVMKKTKRHKTTRRTKMERGLFMAVALVYR